MVLRAEQGVSCVGVREKKETRQGAQGRERGRSHSHVHKHMSKETEIENQSKKVSFIELRYLANSEAQAFMNEAATAT